MVTNNLQNLPPEVKEVVFSSELAEYNLQIADQFSLNKIQLDYILDLEEKIYLQRLSCLDLPGELENMERAKYYDLRELSLEIANKILWPLQDYLKEVDRLILRLGGKVPHLRHLYRHSVQNPTLPSYATASVNQLLKQYPDFKEARLSSKKIQNELGNLVTPSVDNWLKDYIKFLGAGYHSSLQRAKYLSKSENILALNEAEKASIRNFFISYDEEVPMEFDSSDVIVFVKEYQAKSTTDDADKNAVNLPQIMAKIKEQIVVWEKKALPEDILLSEAGNSLHKMRDILWQAIGIQDQDKVIGCLKVLVNKKALDLLIQEDKRFQSIMRRFISVKYGDKFSVWQNLQADKLLARRIFLEMILSDKLHLSQDQSVTAAFYLTNLLPGSGQVVYLDLGSQKLNWRELIAIDNKLVWANESPVIST